MSRPISQREARRNAKELRELRNRQEAMLKRWGGDWPGEHLGWIEGGAVANAIVKTARKLGHAVVVTVGDDSKINFWGAK